MGMGIDDILRIDRIHSQAPDGAKPPADREEFRRLLEQVQRLSEKPQSAAENADELASALQEAEKDFDLAMELRALLEDAFRRKMA
jgi:hypothetical protein